MLEERYALTYRRRVFASMRSTTCSSSLISSDWIENMKASGFFSRLLLRDWMDGRRKEEERRFPALLPGFLRFHSILPPSSPVFLSLSLSPFGGPFFLSLSLSLEMEEGPFSSARRPLSTLLNVVCSSIVLYYSFHAMHLPCTTLELSAFALLFSQYFLHANIF